MGRMKDLFYELEHLTIEERQDKLKELGIMDIDNETISVPYKENLKIGV